jgi:hypothetical protein
MSFTNSEQLYGVSKFVASGAVTKGILNGPGVFFAAVSSLASGAVAASSYSGVSLAVFDAISGATNPTTTAGGNLYFYHYGSTSGGYVLPPDLWAPQPFLSGLNVQISGSAVFNLTVSYRAGI